MTEAVLVGATGLVGRNILSTILASPAISTVHAFSRRALPPSATASPKLLTIAQADSAQWPTSFPSLTPSAPAIFFSAMGTTRATAGGFDAQYAIEHDLNLALATAARAAGVKTYVLVSSHGAARSSRIPYARMKGEIEDGVARLGFEHCVIVRPGLIMGERERRDSRPAEWLLRKVAGLVGSVAAGLKDLWAQDAVVIARAAVVAALMAAEGKSEGAVREGEAGGGGSKVWVLEGSDIVRLGRTQWKE